MENILSAYNEVPDIAEITGYKMKTTFWGDFTVAERIDGIKAVRDTYKRSKCYLDDTVMATELALVLNWKAWEHSRTNPELASEYEKLWSELDAYILDKWKDEALSYYLATTD